MSTSADSSQVAASRASLLAALRERRQKLGVSQATLADEVGLSRMSVARAEQAGADLQLSSFLAMAAGLGYEVHLRPQPGAALTTPMVHRGVAHSRVATAQLARLNPLEAALARRWEEVNEPNPHLGVMLEALTPGYVQQDATVAATVVQWLGSQVGLEFLRSSLSEGGYELVASTGARRAGR